VNEKKLNSVNIWQSYKQERGCLVHLKRLTNTLLKDEESAQDNHVFLLVPLPNIHRFKKKITVRLSNKPLLFFYC